MYYVEIKRKREGVCNICGKTESLTWDHVPPKGGIELTSMQMQSVFSILAGNQKDVKYTESQNGVKYRTICKICNETMGRLYDTTINEFAISVGRYLKSQLTLPPIIYHKTRPAALIRGVLGHLIASKIERDEALFDKRMAPLIFDSTKQIPSDIHIYYWIFPYGCSVTIRDMAIHLIFGPPKNIFFCHFIKYFPIAYMVSDKSPYKGVDELTQFREASLEDEIAIPIRLNDIKPANWPEMVDDTKIIIGGQSMANSIFATRKIKR